MLPTIECSYHGHFSVVYCPDIQEKIYAVKEASGFEEITKNFAISTQQVAEFKSKINLENRNIIFIYISTGSSATGLGIKNLEMVNSVFKIKAVTISFCDLGGTCDMHGNMFAFSVPKGVDEDHVRIAYEHLVVDFEDEPSMKAYKALLAPMELNS